MKRATLIFVLILISVGLFSQEQIFVDCIHGADYYYDWNNFEQIEINWEEKFPDKDITKFEKEDIILDEILVEEEFVGPGEYSITIDLPDGSYPEYMQTLYILADYNFVVDWQPGVIGTLTDPEGNIVAEMFNGVIHLENAYGAGWTVNLSASVEQTVSVTIGTGLPLFSNSVFEGQVFSSP